MPFILVDNSVRSSNDLINQVESAAHTLRRVGGIIIVGRLPHRPEDYLYWDGYGGLNDFGSETEMEDPKIYKTLRNTWKVIDSKLKEDFSEALEIVPALWVHPDIKLKLPLDKYMKMCEGFRFPGSPRR